ncbi:MAG: division/cell wall cluster transcriptional repressor MraZ [Legionellales bacterium]|nr:division/cell wall cluster transcriptional repressor MraZ [Legionellales bacterium]
MFRGINAIALDAKGRLSIPTRYRDALQTQTAQVIITIDTDAPCLLLYPFSEWEIIERKIAELPSFNPVARRIQRLLIGHATEVELDASGRLLVPGVLREYAGLQKEAMLVGQGRKFEIWAAERWQSARNEWLTSDLVGTEEMPNELKNLSL